MASINQVVSEIAHSIRQFDSVPVRRGVEASIYHNFAKLIRESYERHGFTNRSLIQKFRVELINVPDGDLKVDYPENVGFINKRSKIRVPKPIRLTNNNPFTSVRTLGSDNPISIPFVREFSSAFYSALPGFPNVPKYDYQNGYLYLYGIDSDYSQIENVIIEAPFEIPNEVLMETKDKEFTFDKDDMFLIPEDMVEDIKILVLKQFNPDVIRDTSEIENATLVK